MNVLVVGGGGFVGSILVPDLLKKGFKVSVLDKLFFGSEPINEFKDKIDLIQEDIRTFDPSLLKGFDVVVNLAAISQPDQQEKVNPELYYEINHEGCVRVAQLSKKAGVHKYIFTSTCSVYGFQEGIISEENTPNPLEAYGKSKVMAEKETLPLADDDFIVTILRPGTMYGLSPKMRFDLVVNGMTWALQEFKKINVMRDGTQWRPNVHVKDVSRLILKLIDSERDEIQKEIFNVGANDQNYQILPLAKVIGDSVGIGYDLDWYGEPDTRSYRVDFSKLADQLGFEIKHTVPEAAKNVYEALEKGITEKTDKTSVVKWYEKLSNSGEIKLFNI
ncbi:MAG: SDR family oxidoreductase [Promethearchaeia archaeon]